MRTIIIFTLAIMIGVGAGGTDLQMKHNKNIHNHAISGNISPNPKLEIVFNKPITISMLDSLGNISAHITNKWQIPLKRAKPLISPETKHRNNELLSSLRLNHIIILELLPNADLKQVIEKLLNVPEIKSISIDGIGFGASIPDDPEFNTQWGFHSTGSNPSPYDADIDNDIDAVEAWDICNGSSDIIVAVVDGGFDYLNDDLDDREWLNLMEIVDGLDNDSNGYIDDIRGWDFAYDDNNPMDDFGHGTNVAGIIGAEANNSYGTAGLDWNCKLMNLKVLNSSGWGYYTWWASAIIYAADNGANIINLSIGGTDSPGVALPAAIEYAESLGVLLIAAMGNDNSNVTIYPASISGVMAVGAIDKCGIRCNPFCWGGGSNYNTYISVCAPGDYIRSTLWSGEEYAYYCGTSQATAMVSGLASLIMAINPSIGSIETWAIICSTATDLVGLVSEDTPGWDIYHGWGRINAYASLQMAESLYISMSKPKPYVFLISCYPNPFNSSVVIAVETQNLASLPTIIEIYDLRGNLVKRISSSKEKAPGKFVWMPDGDVSSGIYFVRALFNNRTISKRVVLIK